MGSGAWQQRGRDENARVDSPHLGCARGRQRPGDHEQRLQEQPSRMVRLRHPTPCKDWAQLNRAVQERYGSISVWRYERTLQVNKCTVFSEAQQINI